MSIKFHESTFGGKMLADIYLQIGMDKIDKSNENVFKHVTLLKGLGLDGISVLNLNRVRFAKYVAEGGHEKKPMIKAYISMTDTQALVDVHNRIEVVNCKLDQIQTLTQDYKLESFDDRITTVRCTLMDIKEDLLEEIENKR